MNPTNEDTPKLHVASQNKRLFNLILDTIIVAIFSIFSIFPLMLFLESEYSVPNFLVNVMFAGFTCVYRVIFEYVWQRTPAKFITGTKVVNLRGQRPSFLQVLGRSLARYIPFEVLSFLTGKYPVGWHDSLSKTFVVPATYTPEDVQNIDMSKIKKNSSVLRIVIIIFTTIFVIGIVSSIVLAFLTGVREKHRSQNVVRTDAETKIYLDDFQKNTVPGFYSSNNNSYGANDGNCGKEGLFSQGNIGKVLVDGKPFLCVARDDFYQFSMNLPESGEKYCMDSKGFSGAGVPFTTGCKEFGKQYNAADLGL